MQFRFALFGFGKIVSSKLFESFTFDGIYVYQIKLCGEDTPNPGNYWSYMWKTLQMTVVKF